MGIGPEILVLDRDRTLSAFRLPIELGIAPEMLVLYRARNVSTFRLPIELGIVPEMLVLDRNRLVSAFRLPIELGMVPERPVLEDRSRYVSKVRFPIELGIAPFKLLLERRNCVTLQTDATLRHVIPYQLFTQGVPTFQPRLSLQVEPPMTSNKSVSDAISLDVWHSPFWGRTNATSTVNSRRNVVPPNSWCPRFVCLDKVVYHFQ